MTNVPQNKLAVRIPDYLIIFNSSVALFLLASSRERSIISRSHQLEQAAARSRTVI